MEGVERPKIDRRTEVPILWKGKASGGARTLLLHYYMSVDMQSSILMRPQHYRLCH